MLKNYLKIAFRTLLRNKMLSSINIFGLALGITFSSLIYFWVSNELSYDKLHSEQTYRVMMNTHQGEISTSELTPGPLAETLKNEVPEIAHSTKTTWDMGMLLKHGDVSLKETGRYASEDFFSIFSFSLIKGDPKQVLNDPSSIVISKSLASRLFPNENPLGNTININNEKDFIISGIMEDIPSSSSFHFDFVLPQASFEKNKEWLSEWSNNSLRTFVKIHPQASKEVVEAKIRNIVYKNNPQLKTELFLQPVHDIHLYSDYKDGKQAGGRIEYVRLFSIIAVFILLIACINFINLATARSAKRSKEVGIRKVIGAGKGNLIGQFMGEAILISSFALAASIVVLYLILPHFNNFTGSVITIDFFEPATLLLFLFLVIITSTLSGVYPSLYLSSLKPTKTLKGIFKQGRSSFFLRQSLVVFQFATAILLITGTLVVYFQIDYIKNKNIGLNRENVIVIPIEGELGNHLDAYKEQALGISGVKSMTIAFPSPLDVNFTTGDVEWAEKPPGDLLSFSILATGYDFTKTLGVEITEGRDFSEKFKSDSTAVIINETAVKVMDLKDPIGKTITVWEQDVTIIGVIKDFHNKSLYEPIRPQVIINYPSYAESILIKTEAEKSSEVIAALQEINEKINPEHPFQYDFLDETFNNRYKSEMMIGKLAGVLTAIAIIISCMGLFGLSAFTAEQRTKEIGIRKTLGASISNIITLLSKDFIKLVMLSLAIATPLAAYIMQDWLAGFAYKINLDWWVFILAGASAIIIALLTVSFQSIKTALINPADSLRSE